MSLAAVFEEEGANIGELVNDGAINDRPLPLLRYNQPGFDKDLEMGRHCIARRPHLLSNLAGDDTVRPRFHEKSEDSEASRLAQR